MHKPVTYPSIILDCSLPHQLLIINYQLLLGISEACLNLFHISEVSPQAFTVKGQSNNNMSLLHTLGL